MSDSLSYFLIMLSALVILLDIWALVSVFKSDRSVGVKALWAIGIALFPVLGLVAWGLVGPRAPERSR